MRFVPIRELRTKTASIRQDLAKAHEIVLTANGRPFAAMTPVNPDTVEEEIQAIRRARTQAAIGAIHAASRATGGDKLTMDDIDAEIAAVRRTRRKQRA
ncbi:MAG: type II toxin-antitoxin system Phd/YefM family antitoxin [candidate division NC10 bacterium]